MTGEQVSAFLAACTLPHIKLFAILAATTGARMGAILSLTWDPARPCARPDPLPRPDSLSDEERAGHDADKCDGPRRTHGCPQRRDYTIRDRMGGTARPIRKEGPSNGRTTSRDALGYRACVPPFGRLHPRGGRGSDGGDRPAFRPGFAHGRNGLRKVLADLRRAAGTLEF